MIRIDNLSKFYGEKQVIQDLSLTLPDSGIIAICGPSGCGKSTLLSLIAGIETPTDGDINFERGHRSVSVAFQEPRLLPFRTALQNVNFVLGDKKATLGRAEELLCALGIDEVGLYPDELSGGMKARVSIARALAIESDIYLFDEPFANLDRGTAEMTAEIIKKYTAGSLVVAVIHDPSFAEEFADSVILFSETPISGNFVI